MTERALNDRQIRLLRAIEPGKWTCPSKLALALDVPKPFVSRTSSRLVLLGFVSRKRDVSDLRKVALKRLPAGDVFVARLDGQAKGLRAPTAAELDAR